MPKWTYLIDSFFEDFHKLINTEYDNPTDDDLFERVITVALETEEGSFQILLPGEYALDGLDKRFKFAMTTEDLGATITYIGFD